MSTAIEQIIQQRPRTNPRSLWWTDIGDIIFRLGFFAWPFTNLILYHLTDLSTLSMLMISMPLPIVVGVVMIGYFLHHQRPSHHQRLELDAQIRQAKALDPDNPLWEQLELALHEKHWSAKVWNTIGDQLPKVDSVVVEHTPCEQQQSQVVRIIKL